MYFVNNCESDSLSIEFDGHPCFVMDLIRLSVFLVFVVVCVTVGGGLKRDSWITFLGLLCRIANWHSCISRSTD